MCFMLEARSQLSLRFVRRRRVMLKVSGEALQGDAGFGIDPRVGSDCLCWTQALQLLIVE